VVVAFKIYLLVIFLHIEVHELIFCGEAF